MISIELRMVLMKILWKIKDGTAGAEDALAIYENMSNRLRHVQRKSGARKRALREANRVIRERTSWWEAAYRRGPSWKYRENTEALIQAIRDEAQVKLERMVRDVSEEELIAAAERVNDAIEAIINAYALFDVSIINTTKGEKDAG